MGTVQHLHYRYINSLASCTNTQMMMVVIITRASMNQEIYSLFSDKAQYHNEYFHSFKYARKTNDLHQFCRLQSYINTKHELGHNSDCRLTYINLIPAWLSNHIPSKVWDEITYPFPNFNGGTIEVWEWISDFIPHSIMDVITFP